jgi:hypothetical protein
MDDKTYYLDLRTKMDRLLAYINAVDRIAIGACFANGTCTMTTQDQCPSTDWHEGVGCRVIEDRGDYAQASQELLERMGRLLDRIQGTFEAGGKTYRLKMTLQEGKVAGDVG